MLRSSCLLLFFCVPMAFGCGPIGRGRGGDSSSDNGTATVAPDAGGGSTTLPDAGMPPPDAGPADPAAPRIVSLTATPATITVGGSAVVAATVSDTNGLSDLAGGTLVDGASGQQLGSFGATGGQGSFAVTVTWSALNAVTPIDSPTGSTSRWLTATFSNLEGHRASQSVELGLSCGVAAGGRALCSGQCVDLSSDRANCGHCGVTVPPSASCVDGNPVCPSGYEYCNNVCAQVGNARENCGACGHDCGTWAASHGAQVCSSDADAGSCDYQNNAICENSTTGVCQLQITNDTRESCDSLCQALGLRCTPIDVNGSCPSGACSYYLTSSGFECSENTACDSTPPGTETCSGHSASFSALLCGCE